MLHKTAARCVKLSLVALLALVLLAPACKKAPEQGPDDVPPRPPDTTEETGSTAETAPAAASDGLVAIELKLPKPMFVGTPQSFRGVSNLEKPLGKPRPPFYAPKGTVNISAGKPVSASDEEPIIGEIEMITDGDKEAADGSYVELGPFVQHITIDLGAAHDIYAIVIWHYHKPAELSSSLLNSVLTLVMKSGSSTRISLPM
ncbi:hypothetical protein ES707_18674 [subsurface metagenome]